MGKAIFQVVVFQSLKLCPTLWDSMPESSVFQCLSEFAQIHVHWVGGWRNITTSSSATCFFCLSLSQHFSNELALTIRWPKYWSFSFHISPSNEHPGLISFRMDWLDLLAVQGTLKSLFQHHNLKASILWCSAFFYDFFRNLRETSTPEMTSPSKSPLSSIRKVLPLRGNSLPVVESCMFPARSQG